jgi:hypothetical protein
MISLAHDSARSTGRPTRSTVQLTTAGRIR